MCTPIGLDLAKYRAHHFFHHAKTGTKDDADISLVAGLPTTRASLARKFARDLTGLTGLKFLIGLILMNFGVIKWTVAPAIEKLPRQHWLSHLKLLIINITPTVITNAVLWLSLSVNGFGELYFAWVIAYPIPYPLFLRIRSLAEHACTENTLDMFKNTRTTKAGWLARTFVAPLHVNYHIEHHVADCPVSIKLCRHSFFPVANKL